MTVLSTPACRRFIAAVCRSVCGETFLFVRRRAAAAGGGGVLGDQQRDRVAAELAATAGREQWLLRLAVALGEPFAQHGDGLSGQRRGALFAALPEGLNVRAGAEVRVLAAQAW